MIRTKIWFLFLIIIAFCKVETLPQKSKKNSALQKAFTSISEHLRQRNQQLTVVVSAFTSDSAISAVIASFAGYPYVLKRFGQGSQKFQLNSSAIVLLDTIKTLETFTKRTVLPELFSMKQQLFIYCEDEVDIGNHLIDTNDYQYQYFVVEDEKSIRLETYYLYTRFHCDVIQIKTINRLDKSTGRWENKNFWVDKHSNLFGCRIKVLFEGDMPEFQSLEIYPDTLEVTKCTGYTCAIVKDFSLALNFKYNMFDKSILKHSPEIPIELYINSQVLNYKHIFDPNNDLLATRTICYNEHFFTVPPGEEFNGYEKLILPFDEQTWMWLGITFLSAFVTIFVLGLVRRNVANFVKGELVTTPALNVLRAFFGIAQIVCPTRNFARYLLMMFILFSLVIRTAYQGKMFEFLQKEIRKPSVTTIEEMIDNNFTFYTLGGFRIVFNDSDLAKRANIIDNWTFPELVAAYERSYVPGSKTAVFYSPIYNFIIRDHLNRTELPKLLTDRYMLESRALVFGARHAFFDIFDRKLQQYIEGDLINYNKMKWNEENNRKRFEEKKEPFAVLTFGELEAGFAVFMVSLSLSIFAFAIEWMCTWKDLLISLFIFKKLFETKDLEQMKHGKKMKINVATWQKLSQKRKLEMKGLSNNFIPTFVHKTSKSKTEVDTLSVNSEAWSEVLETWIVDCHTK